LFLENLLFKDFKTGAECSASDEDSVCLFAALAFLSPAVIFLLYFSLYEGFLKTRGAIVFGKAAFPNAVRRTQFAERCSRFGKSSMGISFSRRHLWGNGTACGVQAYIKTRPAFPGEGIF
jgi:hypothetical protein